MNTEGFTEMTTNWYILIGPQLIQTALVFAVFPYINFTAFYVIRLLRRFLDSGLSCCSEKRTTKTVTVTQYFELYSGQEIFLYFKYSNFMNLVFMAFTHGVNFPVLWPIALFGCINNYLVERICLAYYYR